MAMIHSALDGIPGLGPTRRQALLKAFGSVKKLRAASAEEIAMVPGIGLTTAQSIVGSLTSNNGVRAPSVNMMTGEILED
mgnify:CR=1 FL=1